MRIKRFLPSLAFILAVLALILIIKYQLPIKNFLLFNFEKAKIHCENFFFQASSRPERRRPVSLLVKETELKLYVGEPFKDFSDEEWEKFWGLIYEGYPREAPEKEGLTYRFRQLTHEEIAAELMELYPLEFSFFQDEHWQIFFGILFGK